MPQFSRSERDQATSKRGNLLLNAVHSTYFVLQMVAVLSPRYKVKCTDDVESTLGLRNV
jgi:hypothetical protein